MNFEASIIYRVEHKTRELPEFSSGHGKMKVGMYSFAWPNGRWKRGYYCEGPDNDPALHPLFNDPSMFDVRGSFFFGFKSMVNCKMWVDEAAIADLQKHDCVLRAYYGWVVHGRRQSVIDIRAPLVEVTAAPVEMFDKAHSVVVRMAREVCAQLGMCFREPAVSPVGRVW